MTRVLTGAVAALLLIAAGLGWLAWSQAGRIATLKDALATAQTYIETRKEIDDATAIPDDPDAVLGELCAIAPRGPGCGNP